MSVLEIRDLHVQVSTDGASIDTLPTMGIRHLTWLIVALPGGGGA